MQRCSESIGSIAGALAKAQGELTNPEKSLTATIQSPFPREANRTFRYASLSCGLDIVRKTLGKHEIALVQTTAIDQESALIRLTTVLAHSSGEWVSSEWPVCGVSETAAPHKMGAALTYARRYALFTLVGIAGEDDLDAPDAEFSESAQSNAKPERIATSALHGNGSQPMAQLRGGSHRKALPRLSVSILSPTESLAMREKLIGELAAFTAAEQLTQWAYRKLPIKNTLVADDALLVEAAFQSKLEKASGSEKVDTLPPIGAVRNTPDGAPTNQVLTGVVEATAKLQAEKSQKQSNLGNQRSARHGSSIDRSLLAISEPRRYRDKAHLRFVSSQACLICGRQPSDAHHLRFAQPRALGRKVSDEFTVPLCRSHHREVHGRGNEGEWWNTFGVDPHRAAEALWSQTRPVQAFAEPTNLNQSALPQQALPQQVALNTGSGPVLAKGSRNRKTKPIIAADPQ